MNDFEKLMFMLSVTDNIQPTDQHYGRYEKWLDDDGHSVIGVKYVKNGDVGWTMSKSDILFNYITHNWGA